MWSMDTIGPLSRTVEDCGMTLQAIAGRDPKDPYTWDVPVPDYRQALDGGLPNTRIGVVKELLYSDVVQPDIRDAVSKAAAFFADSGAQVKEISIPLAAHSNAISTVLRVEAPTNYRDLDPGPRTGNQPRQPDCLPHLEPDSRPCLLYKGLKLRALLRQQVLEALSKFDVLLSPTMGVSPPDITPDQADRPPRQIPSAIPVRPHHDLQLGQRAGPQPMLRLHLRQSPHRAATGRQALRRADHSQHRLRLRAKHRLAHPPAPRIDSPSPSYTRAGPDRQSKAPPEFLAGLIRDWAFYACRWLRFTLLTVRSVLQGADGLGHAQG